MACSRAAWSKTVQTASIAAVPVTSRKSSGKQFPSILPRLDRGKPYSTVSVKAQVNAILEGVHFTQGDFVKKGQLLFTLDAQPFQAAARSGGSQLARDKAQAELDVVKSDRYQKLFDAGVGSKSSSIR